MSSLVSPLSAACARIDPSYAGGHQSCPCSRRSASASSAARRPSSPPRPPRRPPRRPAGRAASRRRPRRPRGRARSRRRRPPRPSPPPRGTAPPRGRAPGPSGSGQVVDVRPVLGVVHARLGQGYFVAASSTARVRLSPAPSIFASSRVSTRSDWALPSNPPHDAAASSSAAWRCGRTAGGPGRGPGRRRPPGPGRRRARRPAHGRPARSPGCGSAGYAGSRRRRPPPPASCRRVGAARRCAAPGPGQRANGDRALGLHLGGLGHETGGRRLVVRRGGHRPRP